MASSEPAACAAIKEFLPAGRQPRGLRIYLEMARELYGARELIWRLFVRDLSARYRQSVLGYLWAVAPAVGTVALFAYLREQRVLSLRETVLPYPLYVLLGLWTWQIFQGGLSAATPSLVAWASLITKVRFPREALVLASLGSVLFDAALRALLVAAAFLWYGVVPAWTVLFLPLVVLPLLVLTAGLGFWLALFHALIRDIGNVLAVLLNLFFFLVPVVYPPPVRWPHVLLNDLNPVSAILIAVQEVVSVGGITRPAGYAAACILSLLIFFTGWRVFHHSQHLVAERI